MRSASGVRRLAVVLAMVAFLAAACGDSEDPAPGDDGHGTPQGPPSGSYEVTSVTVAGQQREPVAGTTIRVDFNEGSVAIEAGCNHLRADYSYADPNLEIGDVGGTEMGCQQDRMDQDAMLGEVLAGTWRVDGSREVTLTKGDDAIVLRPFTVRNRELTGTTWRLDSLITGETVESVPARVTATLEVGDDGSLGFNDGCNSGGGSVEVTADTLRVGELRQTLKGCPGADLQRVGSAYSRVLQGTVGYRIDSDRLTLTKGGSGLGFTAK